MSPFKALSIGSPASTASFDVPKARDHADRTPRKHPAGSSGMLRFALPVRLQAEQISSCSLS
jgi:hypothetical protein